MEVTDLVLICRTQELAESLAKAIVDRYDVTTSVGTSTEFGTWTRVIWESVDQRDELSSSIAEYSLGFRDGRGIDS